MDNELKSWGSFSPEEEKRINEQLRTGIPKEFVKQRAGAGGQRFDYVEGGVQMEIANHVFGALNWSSRVLNIDTDFCKLEKDKWVVGASALVRVQVKSGALHEDLGYGTSKDSNQGNALDKARKAAITDARKRALRCFGELLGNSLKHKDDNSKALNENFGSGNESHSPIKSTPKGKTGQAVPITQNRAPPHSHQSSNFQSPPANHTSTLQNHQQQPPPPPSSSLSSTTYQQPYQSIPQTPNQTPHPPPVISNYHQPVQQSAPATPLLPHKNQNNRTTPAQRNTAPVNQNSSTPKQLVFSKSGNQQPPPGRIPNSSDQQKPPNQTVNNVQQQHHHHQQQQPSNLIPRQTLQYPPGSTSSGVNQQRPQQVGQPHQPPHPYPTSAPNQNQHPISHIKQPLGQPPIQQQRKFPEQSPQQRQPLQPLQQQPHLAQQQPQSHIQQTSLVQSPQSTTTSSMAIRPQSLQFESSSPEQFQYLLTNPPSSASSPSSNNDPSDAELALFDAAFEEHDASLSKKQRTT